jgi:glycosyltransferase involved in cell wall biosynthesis
VDEWQTTSAVANHRLPILVFVGHVTPAKGVRELVMACRDINHPDFRVDVLGPVGDGFRAELKTLAQVKNNGEWLNILGEQPREEVLARLEAGFALALPSHTEGFPNVVLEAMLKGKPVIATPVGAIPDMLLAGANDPCGVCVPVGDVDALRAAIQSLLDEPARATELGRRARERAVTTYCPEKVYAQYRSVWELSVLSQA